MKNIAYLRVSTNEQDIQHQESSIKDYCNRNNITLDKIIADEGISAYSTDISQRNGLQQVLHLAHKGEIDNLIIFESSRLSRQFLQGQTLINEFTQCGVTIHSVTEGVLNQNELDEIMNSFRFFMNKKASQETSARVKSAKKMLRDKGLHQGHRVLWGFKVIDKKEVVDEELKPMVIDFFDLYITQGSKATMEKYNIKSHQALMQRLRNEKYKLIIGENKFNHVQNIIANRTCNKNANTKSLNRSNILFEGLLYHKHCGTKLTIFRDRKGNPLFRCKHCKGNPSVEVKKSFTGNKLIMNLEHEVLNILGSLDSDKLTERYNNRCNKHKVIIEYQLKELQSFIKQKEKLLLSAQTKLERYILEDKSDTLIETITNMIKVNRKELDELKSDLNAKQTQLNSISQQETHQQELINKILDAKEIYSNASIHMKKSILNLLIKRIEVSDIDDYDIYLNI